ncbi:DUF3334 family protein [Deltaproteobacteria bacterium TL4]
MMTKKHSTIDTVSEIFGQATVDVLSNSSGAEVYFSPTIQKITSVFLKPDIGCFVQFTGDYSGLMIINFSREAAMEYYRQSMLFMGMSEEDLAIDHTSDEVVDSIGETVNQIVGSARQLIQKKYGLSAQNNQPKAICIMDSIMLSVKSSEVQRQQSRRLSFKINDRLPFHIELFMEQTEFIIIDPERLKNDQAAKTDLIDIDSLFG